MRRLRENLLVQFSIASLGIMLILAMSISKILSDRLNYNMELLQAYSTASMAGITIEDTDPFSIPSLTREVRHLRWITFGVLGGGFVILYGSLVYIVWDGWRTINRQQAALVRTNVELRETHTQTEQLLTSISSIVIGAGPDERITRWNETAETTFGIAAANVLGRPFLECGIRWNWIEVVLAVSECRQRNRPIRLDNLRYTRPDGKEGFLDITFNPIMGGTDRQAGFLLLARDITERKVLEGQLIQAQKLESIGQLAAGIAHEINTPIQFVGDNTRFLRDAFTDLATLLKQYDNLWERCQMGQPVKPELQQINEIRAAIDLDYLLEEIPSAIDQTLDGVRRVARIVQAMKDFSHPDVHGKQIADLNRALESTLTIARNELKYIADVEIDLDPDLPPVFCQVDEINQVFLNLLINARDAIADAVGDRRNGKGKITVTSRREGNQVVIGVTDTGTGIPEEIQDRIFDPFFTTKEVGRGTGQGLSIAYSAVEKHGGSLAFETEVGKGTTFLVRLPVR
jgi:PAS domain S-box-containing protein